MYGRSGLDRFKKAQSVDPFSVSANASATASKPVNSHYSKETPPVQVPVVTGPSPQVTQVGGGQSTWKPPDWATEPCPGVYYLEVIKHGEVVDRINLDKKRHVFGRQVQACDYVLDHQSVSRQHAAVVSHKNGSIYVIDLGSAHGTFVANERLTKESPVELEAGQSLRFAASTRMYILRKNAAALFPPPRDPAEINLPQPPDPSDEEAVVAYNTFLNQYGLAKPKTDDSSIKRNVSHLKEERPAKRLKRMRVVFKDQVGGELGEIIGISDGFDVETEPGPVGVKEGSLVGKYESLVQITLIPKGKEQTTANEVNVSQTGVTDKLKQVLTKLKTPEKNGIYDDLYGDSFSVKVGSSWAYSQTVDTGKRSDGALTEKLENRSSTVNNEIDDDDDDDDLFG